MADDEKTAADVKIAADEKAVAGEKVAADEKAEEDILAPNPVVTVGSDEVEFVSSNENNVTVLPPITKVGYKLSIFILCIVTAFLVGLVLLISFKTFDASDKITMSSASVSDTVFSQQKEIIKSLQEEKKNYRDFIVQISQMVLLNLLLPTLTAILGYIFGSREGSNTVRKNDNVPVT
ncbi:MAG: hypothetical protein H7Z13_00635 [Ferruginibacter sp.]|nr:hypothetical protein [Ferruginibacter sp.]